MIRWICAKVAGVLPPLPPLPWRPLLGAGATVGPVRPAIVCVAVLCAPAATAPPHLAELITRPDPAPTIKHGLDVAPAEPWRGAAANQGSPVPVPAPGALALFGVGVAGLIAARLKTRMSS